MHTRIAARVRLNQLLRMDGPELAAAKMNGAWWAAKNKIWRLLVAAPFTWIFGTVGAIAQWPTLTNDRATLMAELVTIVERDGWHTNLGRMCVAMKLGPEDDCKFKQISVSPNEPGITTENTYGFNVPLSSPGLVTYVVIFHNGPLVGNFFVVSPQGDLKGSFYRAKGVDYTELPTADARRAFDASMKFWRENLQSIRELGARGVRSKQ